MDLLCDANSGNQAAIGYIDNPPVNAEVAGTLTAYGWAYDFQGVNHIEVDIDGQLLGRSDQGTAVYGNYRPDVPSNDPRVGTPNVGWQAILDTTKLGDGVHEIEVYVVDLNFQMSEIGRRQFVVNNNGLTHQ